jgi:RNase P subunit RPR2
MKIKLYNVSLIDEINKMTSLIKKTKTKSCHTCNKEFSVMYRIQKTKGKIWVFVCPECCKFSKQLPDYRYGGTWKG